MDHYPILVYLCRNEEKCRLVTEVGKVLTAAVSSIAKCEGIITDANQHFCDKTLVTVICKLKTIKNDISKFNFMPFLKKATSSHFFQHSKKISILFHHLYSLWNI